MEANLFYLLDMGNIGRQGQGERQESIEGVSSSSKKPHVEYVSMGCHSGNFPQTLVRGGTKDTARSPFWVQPSSKACNLDPAS